MASQQEAWPSGSNRLEVSGSGAGGLTPTKTSEEEFEETLGSLVDYYSSHAPGSVEAEARSARAARSDDAPVLFDASAAREREVAARVAARRQRHQTVRVAPPRPPAGTRTWAWIIGGAVAMFVGGVATFALMVGPKDFWQMVSGKQASQPAQQHAASAAPTLPSPPPKTTAKGVPHAQPLGSGARARLAAPTAGSGSSGPRAIPLAPDDDKDSAHGESAKAPTTTEKAAVSGDHVKLRGPDSERAARAKSAAEARRARRRAAAKRRRRAQLAAAKRRAARRVRKPARRAKLSAHEHSAARKRSASDWEDPYK